MKNKLLTIVSASVLLFSCSNDEYPIDENNAKTDIRFQATDLKLENSDDVNSFNDPSLENIDSIIVRIDSFQVNVSGQNINYINNDGNGYVDLLRFNTRDTLLWSSEYLPAGTIDDDCALMLDNTNTDNRIKVVEKDGTSKTLTIGSQRIYFHLKTDSEIIKDETYTIKANLANSVRLIKKGDEYELYQGTRGSEKIGNFGLIFSDEIMDNLPE